MKGFRMLIRTLTIITFTFASLAFTASATPQEQPQEEKSIPLINLKFAGGTVSDYVAAVSKASDGINVVVAPEAGQVPMPAVDLQAVTVSAALSVLSGRAHVESRRAIQLIYSQGSTFAENERPIYSIGAQVHGAARGMSAITHNRVWSIAQMQNLKISADDMLTAIQAALDLIGEDQNAAQLRLHEATGILIARGTEDQLDTINDVVEQLERSAAVKEAARQAAMAPDPEKVELKKQLNDQAKIIDQLQAQIAKIARSPREGQNN
jgi:hypothetical protein